MSQSFATSRSAIGVVFDGDDTLWNTEQLYDDARTSARAVVTTSGLDGAAWEARERVLDVANVDKFGFGTERFPTSCIQAYEELCSEVGRPIDASIVDGIRQAARSVFDRDPELVPDARETLVFLRARGVRLALLTKGDRRLQLRRTERSGLQDLFDVIQIVPEKSPAIIRSVVAALGVKPASAWMVGNSMRSDVLPAIEAGLRAVWIDAHVWEYEQASDHVEVEGVISAAQLADVPSLIAS